MSRTAFAAVIGLLLVVGAIGAWGWLRSPHAPPEPSVRYQLFLFDTLPGEPWRHIGLSPGGQDIAFRQSLANKSMIWLKTPDRAAAEPMAGTEGGMAPTFSPDGEWIAFVSDGRLRKVRRDGRDVTTLAEGVAPGNASTAWLDDGTVLFTGSRFDLSAVGAQGQTRVVVPRDSLPNNVFDIAAVPGSRSALVTTCASNCAQAELWAVDLKTGARKRLAERAMRVWHISGGLAVFVETQTARVLAAPYDERTLSFAAPPILVFEDVQHAGGEGISMALSDNGTLLFAPAPQAEKFQPTWVTRDGRTTPVDSAWSFAAGSAATLSPDGRRLAVAIEQGSSTDIWVKELSPAGNLRRLTFDANATGPEWTPDGAALLYSDVQEEGGTGNVRRQRLDGTDSGQTVMRSARSVASVAVLRDTTRLIVRFGPPVTRDIYLALLGVSAVDSFVPLLASDRQEEVAMNLSPDEHWLAYSSTASGRMEVYVVPFPDVKAGRWQVSFSGGRSPRWARSGRELFYGDLRGGIMAVPVTTSSSPTFGERRLLFRLEGIRPDPMNVHFDVSPDDQRFLFLLAPGGARAQTPAVVLVQHWLTDLRERMKGTR